MKKFLLIIVLFLYGITVQAEIIGHKVYAVSENTIKRTALHKTETLRFKATDDYEISNERIIPQNSIITITFEEYVQPKRGKRNGYINGWLYSYTIPSKDNVEIIVKDEKIAAKIKNATKKDMKEIATNASVSAAGKALKIPVFSQVIAVSKGLINPNENESRIKSAGKNLYESTPLIYVEKGEDIKLKKNSPVLITVKDEDGNE